MRISAIMTPVITAPKSVMSAAPFTYLPPSGEFGATKRGSRVTGWGAGGVPKGFWKESGLATGFQRLRNVATTIPHPKVVAIFGCELAIKPTEPKTMNTASTSDGNGGL